MKKLNAIRGATYRPDKYRKDWSFSKTKQFANQDIYSERSTKTRPRKTKRESFIYKMRDAAKQQLENERQRLGIKSTSHKPATILELLGNPI